jgi:hypothetical protein
MSIQNYKDKEKRRDYMRKYLKQYRLDYPERIQATRVRYYKKIIEQEECVVWVDKEQQ